MAPARSCPGKRKSLEPHQEDDVDDVARVYVATNIVSGVTTKLMPSVAMKVMPGVATVL